LDAIENEVLDHQLVNSAAAVAALEQQDQLERLCRLLSLGDYDEDNKHAPLYLIVHNMDGPALRGERIQVHECPITYYLLSVKGYDMKKCV